MEGSRCQPSRRVWALAAEVIIATDGACLGNPGPGGWGWVSDSGIERSGAEPAKTTNNRMELYAVLDALEWLDYNDIREPLTIETDSQYVKGIFTGWYVKWQRRSAKTGLPINKANLDLVERIAALLAPRQVTWVWVRGHNGHERNERADKLANSQAGIAPGERY